MTGHFAIGERVIHQGAVWTIAAYDLPRVLLEPSGHGEPVWVEPYYTQGLGA